MPSPSLVDWLEVRRAYVETDEPVVSIAKRLGLQSRRIYDRARKENWPRRSTRTSGTPSAGARKKKKGPRRSRRTTSTGGPDEPSGPGEPSGPDEPSAAGEPAVAARPSSPAGRRTLVRRLYAAIDTKLALMEARMEKERSGEAVSAADQERDARALATLIKTLESVTELEVGRDRTASDSPGGQRADGADASARADEADRFRRELAERLRRLVGPGA